MDDFYKECQEKVKHSTNPAATIDELLGLSVHDLPMLQLCQFAVQAVTLISTVIQSSACPTQDQISRFQAIRHQLDVTLSYMEQVLEAQKAFPCSPQVDGCWW